LFMTLISIHFFHGHLVMKLIGRLFSRNGEINIVYNDMMLTGMHCGNI